MSETMQKATQEYKHIVHQEEGNLAIIRLTKPGEVLSVTMDFSKELIDVTERCLANNNLKAVILINQGRFFCVGGDVKGFLESGENAKQDVKALADAFHIGLANFAKMDIPVIVGVNGAAAGAGFSLAVQGDYVIASEKANFTIAYPGIGLSPDGGATYLLPRLVGMRKAQEIMYMNQSISAQQAEEWGLVNKVVVHDDLEDEVFKVAQIFLTGAKGSYKSIKMLLNKSFENTFEQQMDLEAENISNNAASADGYEGFRAFCEKRRPNFA